MSESITLNSLDLSGESLTLYLRKADGSLLNTDGDAMVEQEDDDENLTGVFTATLAESRDGLGTLQVRVCVGSETADNLVYDGKLNPGTTVIDDAGYAVLDAATLLHLDGIKTKTDQLDFTSGSVSSNVTRWKGSIPGNLDSNGFAPANVAAINGNTTRASTFSTWLDNNRLDVVLSTALAAADDVTLAAISGLSIPTVSQIRTEMDANSTKLSDILSDTNELQSSIENLPQYGDTQRHTQEAFNLGDKSVDVVVTKV